MVPDVTNKAGSPVSRVSREHPNCILPNQSYMPTEEFNPSNKMLVMHTSAKKRMRRNRRLRMEKRKIREVMR